MHLKKIHLKVWSLSLRARKYNQRLSEQDADPVGYVYVNSVTASVLRWGGFPWSRLTDIWGRHIINPAERVSSPCVVYGCWDKSHFPTIPRCLVSYIKLLKSFAALSFWEEPLYRQVCISLESWSSSACCKPANASSDSQRTLLVLFNRSSNLAGLLPLARRAAHFQRDANTRVQHITALWKLPATRWSVTPIMSWSHRVHQF